MGLASSVWARRVTDQKEVGDGRAEGPTTVGDGGQAAVSLRPEVNDTGSGSSLSSILSTFLKKRSSDVWVAALFFSPEMTWEHRIAF